MKNQEIEFLKTKLNQMDRNRDESRKLFDKKVKAIEEEMKESLNETIHKLSENHSGIYSGLNHLLPLIETIERSSLHGRHFVPSETNLGIVVKMKQIILDLIKFTNHNNIFEKNSTLVSLLLFFILFYFFIV